MKSLQFRSLAGNPLRVFEGRGRQERHTTRVASRPKMLVCSVK